MTGSAATVSAGGSTGRVSAGAPAGRLVSTGARVRSLDHLRREVDGDLLMAGRAQGRVPMSCGEEGEKPGMQGQRHEEGEAETARILAEPARRSDGRRGERRHGDGAEGCGGAGPGACAISDTLANPARPTSPMTVITRP